MDRDEHPAEAGKSSHLQFSLATLLILVTVAALVAASVSELPDWIGAPLLAVVATTAAAVVVGAAIRSKGYALTFYLGAAFPLCMLLVRTSLMFAAFSGGIARDGLHYVGQGGMMQLYGGYDYVGERLSYRWEAAVVLGCAPLVGLVCVAFRWLGDKERQTRATQSERRRWLVPSLACLMLLAVGGTLVTIRAIRGMQPPVSTWDAHDGTSVSPSGKLVSTATTLAVDDPVLVEQNGAWWRGRVKEASGDGSVAIRYVGFDSSWDETVPLSRLQLPASEPLD